MAFACQTTKISVGNLLLHIFSKDDNERFLKMMMMMIMIMMNIFLHMMADLSSGNIA